jgi:hypothetical protein
LILNPFVEQKRRKVSGLTPSFSMSFMRHQFGSIAAHGAKRHMIAALVRE